MNTGFLSPTTIIQNAQGVNSWSNPNNILIPNGQFAVSTGSTNILTLGNFNFNVGQDNLVSNFTVRVKGYRGGFNTTLQIIAIDDTSGVELAYPMTPFQGFSGSNTLYTLASSTFNTSWTVDQANNLKLRLIADGELYLDNIQIECSFVAINPVVPPTPTLGDLVVDEFVQGQRFQLAQSMTASDLFCFVQSFNFPNGSPIQITDFYGNALIVIDQGKAGLEENIRITNIEHNYNGSGLVRLSFTEIENRGLDFAYPYTHDITLCRAHTGTAEVVISNSAPFYDRFLKKNQADVLFSIPIEVKANGSIVTSHVHGFNFVGAGVVITPDGVDPDKVIVTIAGAQNATPVPVATSTATSGTTAVPSLTWQHTTSGIDRLLRVLVSTDAVTAVSSVTYNGVALTLNQTATNGVVRLREYFLVAPPVGTYDIVVTVSPNSVITAGAESYVSVNQSSAIGVVDTDTGNSNNPTATINTITDYSVIVDGIATAQTPIAYVTGSAQQVANYTVTPNTASRQVGSSYQKAGTSPDAVVMDWTITQITDWVHLATEIKGTVATISSGVATVTDDGNGIVNVDNTDPANPVIGFDQAQLETDLNSSGNISVTTDGVTITGDGTIGNPLVAVGGGGGGSGTKLVIDTTPVTVASSSAETSILGGTVQIPANTLGTNDAIRFNIIVDNFQLDNSDVYVKLKYGTTTIGQVLVLSDTLAATKGIISGYIIADGTTNAQKGFLNVSTTNQDVEASGAANVNISKFLGSVYGTATEDSTTNLNLDVTIEFSSGTATNTITTEAVVVEKITDAGSGSDIEIFTSDGTWTKPAGAKKVLVEVWGAGGGGGGGGFANTTNAAGGGGGGGGGSYNKRWFDASELPSSVTVTVGIGGAGGAGTSVPPSGAAGTAGTGSSFGTLANSYGGAGGLGGGFPLGGTGGAGGTISIINPENVGGNGGDGNNSIGTGTPGSGSVLGSGGGGGGAGCASLSSSGGSAGGTTNSVTTGGGSAGGAAGANGSNGTDIGEGGGSGGSAHNGIGGNGGNGGVGAGGGGGGASNQGGGSGGPSGDGGDGGRGEVRVTTFF